MKEDQSARALGLASKAVMKHLLMALERKGVLSKTEINGLLRSAASTLGAGDDLGDAAIEIVAHIAGPFQ